jgi:hypothetical protein
MLSRHGLALAERTGVLDGIATTRAFVDIDSLLRPVDGHAKQGASFGHTKIANRQVLRKGLPHWRPPSRLRWRRPCWPGSGSAPARLAPAGARPAWSPRPSTPAKAAGTKNILVRGDSAYGNGKVITAVREADARFSLTLTKAPSVNRAIGLIDEDAWTPVHYPGEVIDPDTGALISDAEVAEIEYTAFKGSSEEITVRLVVRKPPPGPRPEPSR